MDNNIIKKRKKRIEFIEEEISMEHHTIAFFENVIDDLRPISNRLWDIIGKYEDKKKICKDNKITHVFDKIEKLNNILEDCVQKIEKTCNNHIHDHNKYSQIHAKYNNKRMLLYHNCEDNKLFELQITELKNLNVKYCPVCGKKFEKPTSHIEYNPIFKQNSKPSKDDNSNSKKCNPKNGKGYCE